MSKKSRQKKDSHERTLANVLLATALIELLIKLIEFIELLIE